MVEEVMFHLDRDQLELLELDLQELERYRTMLDQLGHQFQIM